MRSPSSLWSSILLKKSPFGFDCFFPALFSFGSFSAYSSSSSSTKLVPSESCSMSLRCLRSRTLWRSISTRALRCSYRDIVFDNGMTLLESPSGASRACYISGASCGHVARPSDSASFSRSISLNRNTSLSFIKKTHYK